MKHSRFVALSSYLLELSRAQIDKVRKQLQALSSALDSSLALAGNDPISCRHCLSTSLVRFGFQNGMQRFRCKVCAKTCCATTGTPLAHLSGKHQLAGYAECMSKGYTLRQTARTLKMTLDRAFRWRHCMRKEPIGHQPKAVKGIIEVDETHFKISRKGQRGLGQAARKCGGRAAHKGRFSSTSCSSWSGESKGSPTRWTRRWRAWPFRGRASTVLHKK